MEYKDLVYSSLVKHENILRLKNYGLGKQRPGSHVNRSIKDAA